MKKEGCKIICNLLNLAQKLVVFGKTLATRAFFATTFTATYLNRLKFATATFCIVLAISYVTFNISILVHISLLVKLLWANCKKLYPMLLTFFGFMVKIL